MHHPIICTCDLAAVLQQIALPGQTFTWIWDMEAQESAPMWLQEPTAPGSPGQSPIQGPTRTNTAKLFISDGVGCVQGVTQMEKNKDLAFCLPLHVPPLCSTKGNNAFLCKRVQRQRVNSLQNTKKMLLLSNTYKEFVQSLVSG